MGHQDAFLQPSLSVRYRLSQGTLAESRVMGEMRRNRHSCISMARPGIAILF